MKYLVPLFLSLVGWLMLLLFNPDFLFLFIVMNILGLFISLRFMYLTPMLATRLIAVLCAMSVVLMFILFWQFYVAMSNFPAQH